MMHVSNKVLDSSIPLKNYISYFGYVIEFRLRLVHLNYMFWTSVTHYVVPILRVTLPCPPKSLRWDKTQVMKSFYPIPTRIHEEYSREKQKNLWSQRLSPPGLHRGGCPLQGLARRFKGTKCTCFWTRSWGNLYGFILQPLHTKAKSLKLCWSRGWSSVLDIQ